jgi:hypothetical protein
MLLELARPVTLLASMLSLLAVFHTAFLGPEVDIEQRIYDSLCLLVIAAGISLLSGLTFREQRPDARVDGRITDTFPVQVFCWATGTMLVLFVLAWYMEANCIFSKNVRF